MSKSVFLESHNIKNRAGGLGTFNYELIKAIAKENPTDLDITLNSADTKILSEEFGSTFSYNKYKGLHRYPLFRLRTKYDVWHSMNQNTKVEPAIKPGKYILTVHDVNFIEEDSSDLNSKKNRQFIEKLRRSDAITYISEFAKAQTHQYFDVPKVEEKVIYNGNPITEFLDTSSFISTVPVNMPYFYSIGDFIERKNFIAIIKMFKNIKDFNLIISGNHDKSYGVEIKNFIRENKLENRVFLTGKVSDVGKQYYMKNCVAFLFPSIREGFGLPPIEAMKFQKPIFLSTKTSLPEIGGDAAFYWQDFDTDYMLEFLFEKLSEFESNPEFYRKKILAQANSFEWSRAANSFIELYRS